MTSGIEVSQPAGFEAAMLKPTQDAARRIPAAHVPVLEAAAHRYLSTQEAPTPVRLRIGGETTHHAVKGTLFLGDWVRVPLSGINVLDYPVCAALMSISAVTAVVKAGLVRSELRVPHAVERRACDPETLSPERQPFRHLFSGANVERGVLKLIVAIVLTTSSMNQTTISAGSAAIKGVLIDHLYGGNALAVAVAGYIESFTHANRVADIFGLHQGLDAEMTRHQRLAASAPRRTRLERQTEATPTMQEHTKLGGAAQDRGQALKWGILRRNPGVAGHGPAATQSDRSAVPTNEWSRHPAVRGKPSPPAAPAAPAQANASDGHSESLREDSGRRHSTRDHRRTAETDSGGPADYRFGAHRGEGGRVVAAPTPHLVAPPCRSGGGQ